MDGARDPFRLRSPADIDADLQDPALVAEKWHGYEAEMFKRFGPKEKWPKLDRELSTEELSAREAARAAQLARWAHRDEKRRRRMARTEARIEPMVEWRIRGRKKVFVIPLSDAADRFRTLTGQELDVEKLMNEGRDDQDA